MGQLQMLSTTVPRSHLRDPNNTNTYNRLHQLGRIRNRPGRCRPGLKPVIASAWTWSDIASATAVWPCSCPSKPHGRGLPFVANWADQRPPWPTRKRSPACQTRQQGGRQGAAGQGPGRNPSGASGPPWETSARRRANIGQAISDSQRSLQLNNGQPEVATRVVTASGNCLPNGGLRRPPGAVPATFRSAHSGRRPRPSRHPPLLPQPRRLFPICPAAPSGHAGGSVCSPAATAAALLRPHFPRGRDSVPGHGDTVHLATMVYTVNHSCVKVPFHCGSRFSMFRKRKRAV